MPHKFDYCWALACVRCDCSGEKSELVLVRQTRRRARWTYLWYVLPFSQVARHNARCAAPRSDNCVDVALICEQLTYIVMAYIVVVYIVMAYTAMAYGSDLRAADPLPSVSVGHCIQNRRSCTPAPAQGATSCLRSLFRRQVQQHQRWCGLRPMIPSVEQGEQYGWAPLQHSTTHRIDGMIRWHAF